MSNHEAKPKADGAESVSTAGLGAWLPIETAPKDGTVVDVRFFRPWVYTDRKGETQDWCCRARYDARAFGGWRHVDDGQSFSWAPTHWRAITEAPNVSSAS